MRAHRLVVVSALAATVATPNLAEARPHLPRVLGAVFGGVGALVGLHHIRHHHHDVSHAAHHPSRQAARTPEPSRETSQPSGSQDKLPAQVSTAAVWPNLPADLADYIFRPSGKDDPFWSYGYAEVVETAMRPARGAHDHPPARRAQPARAVASVGAATPNTCAGQQGTEVANSLIERIEQTISPTDAQQGALAELRDALRHGLDYFDSACSADRAQSPSARLDAMEDRIWAGRQALLVIRAPLAKFYGSLTDEQKARLNGPAAQPGEREATCTQTNPELPIARPGHGARPSADQRAGLEALKQTSAGLAKLVAESCPSGLPATPIDRLDAADKRLNALLYSVATLRAPLEGVYASSNDPQKSRMKPTR